MGNSRSQGGSQGRSQGSGDWRNEEWGKVYERRRNAFAAEHENDSEADSESESDGVSQSQPKLSQPEQGRPEHLTGLSLSGGGIRSALYNDGFLQGLSHCGLLRYVDYLCSVSGGGYIAGHLTAQAEPEGLPVPQRRKRGRHQTTDDNRRSDRKIGFHDSPKRRELGRHPESGKVDQTRLAGIGGYLSRPFEFIPSYLWSFFFSFAFYIGVVGTVSTLAALFWRSFDGIIFRQVFHYELGLTQFGDELMIALIPAILIACLALAGEAFIALVRYINKFESIRLQRFHTLIRAVAMPTVAIAFLTSIAIFLGNGKSSVRSDGGALYLNHYAQYFAITAGIIQVIVFLGRDRLFRSERAEAKQWQRYVQQSVTTMVLLFLVFSMVHWMGRENISNYTKHRDPHLVLGDVLDWSTLHRTMAKFEQEQDELYGTQEDRTAKSPPDISVDELRPVVKNETLTPTGKWASTLARERLGMFGIDPIHRDDLSVPSASVVLTPSTDSVDEMDTSDGQFARQKDFAEIRQPSLQSINEAWSLPQRIFGGTIAYWMYINNHSGISRVTAGENTSETLATEREQDKDLSFWAVISDAVHRYQQADEKRTTYLYYANSVIQTPAFTKFLLRNVGDFQDGSLDDKANSRSIGDVASRAGYPNLAIDKAIKELINSDTFDLSEGQRQRLVTSSRAAHLSVVAGQKEINQSNAALTNRLLLEAFLPSDIQRYDVASTFVVPVHDQTTRKRFLIFWMSLGLVGLIGGLGTYRISTVFQFYRKQLSNNFLIRPLEKLSEVAVRPGNRPPEQGGFAKIGEWEMKDLKPEEDGLPYPLILAAALEPTSVNGSYRVQATPFVFSPLYSGSFETGQRPIPSDQLSFSRYPGEKRVTLGDAVTLSGAAVTPLMSGNRWLSLMLDFFNTGIGQRVWRLDGTGDARRAKWRWPLLVSLGIGIAVVFVSWNLLEMRWSIPLALTFTWLLCFCFLNRVGSPGLIRSLFLTREPDRDSDPNDRRSHYIADGGYHDYLGVSELLRRECELIIVSDAGANVGEDSLGTLARMCEKASEEMGVRFIDLDHEAPIDFGRLEMNEERLVHQPYICMRVRYPQPPEKDGNRGTAAKEGILIYCQMSITDSDPIEIQHIRNLFPSFPDEPTVNQFYNEKQVAAYRTLGYHIANRVCSEIHHWGNNRCTSVAADSPPRQSRGARYRECLLRGSESKDDQSGKSTTVPKQQPFFAVLEERLLTAYRLACYEESSYRTDDIFSEAIWPSRAFAFPTFQAELERLQSDSSDDLPLPERWLRRYECNADVRSAYRTAVISDINTLGGTSDSLCGELWDVLDNLEACKANSKGLLAAHLTCVAVACQEVHRGRPHSTFQVGGRAKLIDLCGRISEQILDRTPGQIKDRCCEVLIDDMDTITAELIELERAVFQGSEHVSTLSFAQCVTTAWGKYARRMAGSGGDSEEQLVEKRVFSPDGPLVVKRKAKDALRVVPDMNAAKIRFQIDKGLRKMDLELVRVGLAKSWYLGYLTPGNLKGIQEQERRQLSSDNSSAGSNGDQHLPADQDLSGDSESSDE